MQLAYRDAVTEQHGEDYDWKSADLDVSALYSSGGGKKHGR